MEAGIRVDITSLIAPRSIVIVGVKVAEPQSWGHRVTRVLLEGGYKGSLRIVHPRDDFPGVETVRSLADCPPPDLVVICVRAGLSVQLVREARELGARAAVVFASEFAEFGEEGARLEAELAEAAGSMPMLGPNCLGFANRTDDVKISVAPFLNRPLLPSGPVALVAQSGALGVVLTRCVENAGLGYSHFVSVGNETRLTASMVTRELLERDDVEVVIMYLEMLRDPEVLARAAMRARDLGKRILLLQAGLSAAGQRTALSHTAAIAGNAQMIDALCRDFGIIRLEDDDAVKPLLTALRNGWSLPAQPRVAVLSNSGGAAAVLADRLTAAGAQVEPFRPETLKRIRDIKLAGAGDSNPIDIGGGWEATLDRVEPTLAALDADSSIDAVLVYYAFGEVTIEPLVAVAAMCARLSKPAVFIWQIAPSQGLQMITDRGVMSYSMAEGVRDLLAMRSVDVGSAFDWEVPAPSTLELPSRVPGQATLGELESAEILRGLGVRMVPSLAARPAERDQLVLRSAGQGWTRMVVKANAHDVPHRNHHDLVRIGVTEGDLPGVLADFAERLGRISTDAAHRLIVQPQVEFEQEIGVGGVIDPAFGPVLMVGPGGVNIEGSGGKRQSLLLNAGAAAHAAFAATVERDHGLKPGEFSQVIKAVDHVLRSGIVTEIDLNPMIRSRDGDLVALDALMVLRPDA